VCGIAGLLTNAPRQPREIQALLSAMAQRMAHRGPDGEGFFADAHCGLASRRLAIIDIPGGSQPMVHAPTGAVLVFNGEIYNYQELRAELAALGHSFATRSDTEVLLAALMTWGTDAMMRLHGMFAFALWEPQRRTLTLGRDRLGKKPLVMAQVPDGILFASEIKSLLVHPQAPRSLDPTALAQAMDYGFAVPPRTFVRAVTQLPPGHWCTICADDAPLRLRPQRYWQLPEDLDPPASRAEAAAQLTHLLSESVAQRLHADVPVACYLSGGIDSSAVAALTARHSTAPVQTISITFAEHHSDESPFARMVSRHAGTQHHEFRCRLDPEDLPRLIWHLEAPLVTLLHLPLYLLARTARELGFRVVLCGDGSDEVLAGYDYFKFLKLLPFIERAPQRRLPLLCRVLPPGTDRAALPGWYAHLKAAPCRHPSLPYRFQAFRFASALMSDSTLAAMAANAHERSQEIPAVPPARSLVDQALFLEAHMRLPGLTLLLGDAMSMAHGVELRSPFLDHRLVEWAFRIPAHWKLRGLTEKALLKNAMAPILPAAICQRRKQPLAAPAPWFVRTFREMIGDTLAPATVRRLDYFRPQFLEAALARFDAGGEDAAGILVVAFFLHLFHEQFLKSATA
jgi:asparagine synthase (glutamine-hydrolysing)